MRCVRLMGVKLWRKGTCKGEVLKTRWIAVRDLCLCRVLYMSYWLTVRQSYFTIWSMFSLKLSLNVFNLMSCNTDSDPARPKDLSQIQNTFLTFVSMAEMFLKLHVIVLGRPKFSRDYGLFYVLAAALIWTHLNCTFSIVPVTNRHLEHVWLLHKNFWKY